MQIQVAITKSVQTQFELTQQKLTKKSASGIGLMKRVNHLVPQATVHLKYQTLTFFRLL